MKEEIQPMKMIQQSWPNVHEARSILWGSSHYFDADTMRCFSSRYAEGAFYRSEKVDEFSRPVKCVLVARESVQGPGMAREYRVVVIVVNLSGYTTRVPVTRSTSRKVFQAVCAQVAAGTFDYNGEG